MSYSNPVFSTADKSAIDVTRPDGLRTTLVKDDPRTGDLYEQAMAADAPFGAIGAYVAPVLSVGQTRALIEQACAMRVEAVLAGKGPSMLREAAWLQAIVAGGQPLSDEQKAEVAMFEAINAWEAAMIEKREALIAAGDVAGAMPDATWPASPAGLAEFLTGF